MCNIMSAWHKLPPLFFFGARCLLVHVLVHSLCVCQVLLVFTLLHVTTTDEQTPAAPNVLSMTRTFLFVPMGLVYHMPSTIMCTYQELAR